MLLLVRQRREGGGTCCNHGGGAVRRAAAPGAGARGGRPRRSDALRRKQGAPPSPPRPGEWEGAPGLVLLWWGALPRGALKVPPGSVPGAECGGGQLCCFQFLPPLLKKKMYIYFLLSSSSPGETSGAFRWPWARLNKRPMSAWGRSALALIHGERCYEPRAQEENVPQG